jgi:hypothetical protein
VEAVREVAAAKKINSNKRKFKFVFGVRSIFGQRSIALEQHRVARFFLVQYTKTGGK